VLSESLIEQQVEEAVMESTVQYWKSVWGALERYWRPMCVRVGKVQAGCAENFIWRKPYPIPDVAGVSEAFETQNVW
jgi:hypothetical protein